jgi:hypothetical protein
MFPLDGFRRLLRRLVRATQQSAQYLKAKHDAATQYRKLSSEAIQGRAELLIFTLQRLRVKHDSH